jgi:hypothetical protein
MSVLFHIYADASDHQLRAVIMQDKKPIAFYSRKLNTAQKWYTTTERHGVVISYLKLQGIQEYPIRLTLFHHSLYRP